HIGRQIDKHAFAGVNNIRSVQGLPVDVFITLEANKETISKGYVALSRAFRAHDHRAEVGELRAVHTRNTGNRLITGRLYSDMRGTVIGGGFTFPSEQGGVIDCAR